jgi:hypothetical protein
VLGIVKVLELALQKNPKGFGTDSAAVSGVHKDSSGAEFRDKYARARVSVD